MTRTRKRAANAEADPKPVTPKAKKFVPPKPATSMLRELANETNTSLGKGIMVKAKLAHAWSNHIPFGHLIGDLATLGGLSQGKSHMFLGQPGGGKTTQAMRMVANAQMKFPYHNCLWVDTEQTFDPVWAEQHGVDMDRLWLVSPHTGEQAVDLIEAAIEKTEDLCLVVLDSVNMCTPSKLVEDAAGDANVALLARLTGVLTSKVMSARAKRHSKGWVPITMIYVNQWRERIGGYGYDTKKIPGGNQLKYSCATWIEFKSFTQEGSAKKGEGDVGMASHVDHVFTIKRGKSGSSIRSGEYSVVVGGEHHLPIGSSDEAGTVLAQAKKYGLWAGAGKNQYFTTHPDKIFAKMVDGIDWLEDNPDEMTEMKRLIVAAQRLKVGLKEIPPDGYLMRP